MILHKIHILNATKIIFYATLAGCGKLPQVAANCGELRPEINMNMNMK